MDHPRPRLLITGTMSRADILDMFRPISNAADLTFVEYERDWGQGINRALYQSIGEITTWEESGSADHLLRRVRPDRVVLLFISSLNQVALRVAAKDHGIEAVHVEHGYRLLAADAPPARTAAHRPNGARLGDRHTHAFFARSLRHRGARIAATLSHYAVTVGRQGATPEVLRQFAHLRRPDRYISYARECFEFHRDVDRVPAELAASTIFTGIPQLDDFRLVTNGPTRPELLLIDHQFHNSGLFGWDEAFRREWVSRVADTVLAGGFERVYVKLHPGDRSGCWDPYVREGDVCLVERTELANLSQTVQVVLGTFSTMQMPFAAQPHVALLSLEIHPQRGWFPSRRLVEMGVSAPVRGYKELDQQLRDTEVLRAGQKPAKPRFIKRFLERLDGRAGERMTAALLVDCVPR